MEIMLLISAFVVLDLLAWRWGVVSREAINDPEWQRRRDWPGFHHTR